MKKLHKRPPFRPGAIIVLNSNDMTSLFASALNTNSGISGLHSPIGRKGHSPLRWRHNDQDGVSNHQPHGCLLNRLFRRRSNKTSKLRVTGLCVGNSPGPVNSPHKGPVTRKMFPFDDVIMPTGSHWMDDRNTVKMKNCWVEKAHFGTLSKLCPKMVENCISFSYE